SRVSYLSTETWVRYLRPWAPADCAMVTTPIPSTVPACADLGSIERWRRDFTGGLSTAIAGHFGTFGDHLAGELEAVIPAILEQHPAARFACIGQGSDAFAARIVSQHPALTARVVGTGALPAAEVSAALRACDVVVQPYPDGVTTRR